MKKKTESRSIEGIVSMQKQDLLNFSPSYQRDSNVWSKRKKQNFIFSLFNHEKYVIPPIYVNVRPQDKPFSPDKFDIVDGKQRLTTILEFVTGKELQEDGKWVDAKSVLKVGKAYDDNLLDDDSTGIVNFSGLTFSKLPAEAKNYLLFASIDFVLFDNYRDKTMRNIFSLLQEGVPLNQAEKLKALDTDLTNEANALEKRFKTFFTRIKPNAKRSVIFKTTTQLLSLAMNPKVITTGEQMRKLLNDSKYNASQINAGVSKVADFLTYMTEVALSYPADQAIAYRFSITRLNTYFHMWLENGEFTLTPSQFRDSIECFESIESPELVMYRSSLVNTANTYSSRKERGTILAEIIS